MVGTSRFGKPSIDLKMLVLIVEEISFPAGGTYALKRSFIDYEVNNNKKTLRSAFKWMIYCNQYIMWKKQKFY